MPTNRLVYNKLVRDNVPSIIKGKGAKPSVVALAPEQRERALWDKLADEVAKARRAPREATFYELIDVVEVVHALCETTGHTPIDLELTRQAKRRERGSFKKGYFLRHIEKA